jgi:hypothetical protein
MLMRLLAVLVVGFLLNGCAAVLVGGVFYGSSKTSEKQKYTTDFNQQNLEREKAGLKPLDWCSETYKLDKAWAVEDDSCAERIRKYEAGDANALVL